MAKQETPHPKEKAHTALPVSEEVRWGGCQQTLGHTFLDVGFSQPCMRGGKNGLGQFLGSQRGTASFKLLSEERSADSCSEYM